MIFIALILLAVAFPATSQSSSDTVPVSPAPDTHSCIPEVLVHLSSGPIRICLNRFDSHPDSCIQVTISSDYFEGILLHFSRSDTTGWRYSGFTRDECSEATVNMRIEVTDDQNGNLQQAAFFPESHDTTNEQNFNLKIVNDRPVEPDTITHANLHLRRFVRSCRPEKDTAVVENRVYTYPPNYRRDPVYNYPELSMFHCGMSVRMPTTESLENRAQLYIYWHCNTLAPLRFEEPEALVKEEALKNRFKRERPPEPAKKKRKPLFRFRPIR